MEVTTLTVLAFVSGALMLLGYVLYIGGSLKRDIDPNPTTWLMFAYGTLLLTVLEAKSGAGWALLVVPATCAALSAVVALILRRRGKLRFPTEWRERIMLIVDVGLTIGYVWVWTIGRTELDETMRNLLTVRFLIISNASTLVEFVPLLASTRAEPYHERALPWMVWATSYAVLGVATYLEDGLFTWLMLYPAMNFALHFLVGALALPQRRRRELDKLLNSGDTERLVKAAHF